MLSVNVVKRKMVEPKILFSSIFGSESGYSPEIGRADITVIEKIHSLIEPAQFFSLKLLWVVGFT